MSAPLDQVLAASLVCRVMAQRESEGGGTLVNVFGLELPEGMPGDMTGPHGPFVPLRDLAYYGAHGKVRPADG